MGKLDQVDVAILCGGIGSRLATVLNGKPKPMIDVNGKPFLELIIEKLQKFGFRRFIFCSGYKGEQIEEYFKEKGEYYFSLERSPLGTAGALKFAERFLINKNILLLNGDSFCSINYQNFVDFHEKKNALLSIVVAPVNNREDGGKVSVDEEQKIVSFAEKQDVDFTFINAGVYILRRELLELIPEGVPSSLEYDILPKVGYGEAFAFCTENKLFDIGTPERLENFRFIMKETS